MSREQYATMPEYSLSEQQPHEAGEASHLIAECWLETFPNDDFGVSYGWIKDFQEVTQEKISRREAALEDQIDNPDTLSIVAKDETGVIGLLGASRDYDTDRQHLGALYVANEYRGKGVAQDLMLQFLDWRDRELDTDMNVVVYNERAKAFYKKYGFYEVPDSEFLFEDKLPMMSMVLPRDSGEEAGL